LIKHLLEKARLAQKIEKDTEAKKTEPIEFSSASPKNGNDAHFNFKPSPVRPSAFILASCNHGTMIVNKNDHNKIADLNYGVGYQILNNNCFDPAEVNLVLNLLMIRRTLYGDGVVAIDGGANIGVHTIEWSRQMYGWGKVIAFEAQEYIYYSLAGNIVLNNCLNASARLAALGGQCGEMFIPKVDYFKPSSYGSLELKQRKKNEFIGQTISYTNDSCERVPMVALDSLGLNRVDFIKLDIEGMEMDALGGGRHLIQQCHPIMLIEHIKSDLGALTAFFLQMNYSVLNIGDNILAIHSSDETLNLVYSRGMVARA
jgi:FkbM family methyltransferase